MVADLKDVLERLWQRDVDTRNQLLREGRLFGAYDEVMQKVHVANGRALQALVNVHGWPGISRVGLAGARTAWLIAQHAICTPGLQRVFLQLLTAAAESDDAPMQQVALLTDRIRCNEGRPQVYGTVLDWTEAGELGCEIEDPATVDERRAAVGLPPYEASLCAHRNEIEAEGGRPPDDYSSYRRAALAWAKAVGWR